MHCTDTNSLMPAVRLEHLNVKAMTILNTKIGRLKKARIWNAVINLCINGGNIDDDMKTFKAVKLPED